MNPAPPANGWSLEVVRGKDVGRAYALNGAEVVLGNALDGAEGIDLADQEGASPRRMAARQARIECARGGLSLRDLDSPGGTFVNRQRILSGEARPLREGDVIQLGSVQVRVVARPAAKVTPAPAPAPPPPSPAAPPPKAAPAAASGGPGTAAFAFAMKGGATCRSWDDFLTVSAQRWAALREELTSGRLSAFLASIGREDLKVPASGTADERLDAWLAGLPTTKSSRPELDVHPATLAIKVAAGGGTTRRSVQVSNTGYRLLRATARVEPAGTPWLALPPEFAGRPIVTAEGMDLPIEVAIPERLDGPLSAAIVLDGNGGTRRVAVTLEPAAPRDELPEPVAAAPADWGLHAWVARQGLPTRILAWGAAGAMTRGLVRLGDGWIAPTGGATPGLAGPAVLFALLGGAAGAILAGRRGSAADAPAGGFAGACLGVFAAAVVVAACRAIEPASGTVAALGLWAALGAAAAVASAWLIPHRPEHAEFKVR